MYSTEDKVCCIAIRLSNSESNKDFNLSPTTWSRLPTIKADGCPEGELFDFWNGGVNVKQFLKTPKIIRPTFLKTSNNQLSSSEKNLMLRKWLGHWHIRNIRPQILSPTPNFRFQTTDSTFATSKFQIPNNLAGPKLQTQISKLSPRLKSQRVTPGHRTRLPRRLILRCNVVT